MVVEKHDGLWQNNELYINMLLRRYIGSGYPRILLTALKYKLVRRDPVIETRLPCVLYPNAFANPTFVSCATTLG
jgi:hypothetical protein